MNILIVGGAGYIGSVLSNELQAAGHEVTVLDFGLYGTEHLNVARIIDEDVRHVKSWDAVYDEVRPQRAIWLASPHMEPAGDNHNPWALWFSQYEEAIAEFVMAATCRVLIFGSHSAHEGGPRRQTEYAQHKRRLYNKYGQGRFPYVSLVEPATVVGYYKGGPQRPHTLGNAWLGGRISVQEFYLKSLFGVRRYSTLSDVLEHVVAWVTAPEEGFKPLPRYTDQEIVDLRAKVCRGSLGACLLKPKLVARADGSSVLDEIEHPTQLLIKRLSNDA